MNGLTEDQAEHELGLLYNYERDDSRQFTRWQMQTAIAHGFRLAASSPVREQQRETGWLIEMANNDAPCPRWWHPQKGWVWDANKALRFARKQDAEEFSQSRLHGAGGKATEHAWG